MHIPVSKLIPDIEESDGDGSGTDTIHNLQNMSAILVQTNEVGNLIGNRLTPNLQQNNVRKPTYSDMVTVASVNETFVQDNGVVVTAL